MNSSTTMPARLRSAITILALLILTAYAARAESQIRVVHLSPDAPPVDIYVDGASSPTVAGLGFGGASAVLPVASGTIRLKITPAGFPQIPVFDADVAVPQDTRIDIIALNRVATPEASTIALPLNTAPHPDSASLRLVQGAPDLGPVDVTIVDAAGVPHTFEGVEFKSQSQFISLPRGNIRVEVRSGATLLLRAGGNLAGAERSTLFLSGLPADLKLRLLNETSVAQQIPMRVLVPPPTTGLRVVNVLASQTALDAAVDGTPRAAGLRAGDASGVFPVDTGRRQLTLSADGELLKAPVTLHGDSAYTALAIGHPDSATTSLLVLGRPAAPQVPQQSVLLRVVDASPGPLPLRITAAPATGAPVELSDALPGQSSSFQMVPAGPLTASIALAGQRVLYQATGALPGGSVVTLIATRNQSEGYRFQLLLESDTARQAPMVRLTAVKRSALRVVHVAPERPSLQVILGGDSRKGGLLTPLEASPLTDDFYPGPTRITISPDGGTLNDAVADTLLSVRSQILTTVFLAPVTREGKLGILALDASEADAAPSGRVALRLLNVYRKADALDILLKFGDGSTRRVDALAFTDDAPYVEAPPGPLTVTLTEHGSSLPLLTVSGTIPPQPAATLIVADAGTISPGEPRVHLVIDFDSDGQRPIITFGPASSVHDDAVAGSATAMAVVPNPASGTATLTYTLGTPGAVSLALYDPLGRRAMTIEEGPREAGAHTVSIPAGALPAGIYTVLLSDAGRGTLGRSQLVIVR